jgi:hypothetical protein
VTDLLKRMPPAFFLLALRVTLPCIAASLRQRSAEENARLDACGGDVAVWRAGLNVTSGGGPP